MKRLFRPLVYAVGFSVFAACTTTKTRPVHEVPLSNEPRDLEVTLTDGSGLAVRSATIGSAAIRGEISAEDSRRLSRYFDTWQRKPSGSQMSDGIENQWTAFSVVVPVSDVSEVAVRTGTSMVGVLLVVLLFAGVAYGLTTLDLDFDFDFD